MDHSLPEITPQLIIGESITRQTIDNLSKKIGDILENLPFITNLLKSSKLEGIRVFGGFVRWVVENENVPVSAVDFLETGSDIDVRAEGNMEKEVIRFFKKVMTFGGAIEYAGKTYDPTVSGANLEVINIDNYNFVDSDEEEHWPRRETLRPGHYMVYIPVCTFGNLVIVDAGEERDANTRWLKYDVIFARCNEDTDFTVNTLEYPTSFGEDEFYNSKTPAIIDDIRARRIIWETEQDSLGVFFRVRKLLQKGYNIVDPSFFMMKYYMCVHYPSIGKSSVRNIRENTDRPSTFLGTNRIYPTRHPLVEITPELVAKDLYISAKLEEYRNVELHPLFLEAAKFLENPGNAYYMPVVGVTDREIKVYKRAILKPESKNIGLEREYRSFGAADTNICLELTIPSGTKYVMCIADYTVRFETAVTSKIFSYPDVPITLPSTHHVMSYFDKSFEYPLGKVVHARSFPIGSVYEFGQTSYSGIYAALDLYSLWGHVRNPVMPWHNFQNF